MADKISHFSQWLLFPHLIHERRILDVLGVRVDFPELDGEDADGGGAAYLSAAGWGHPARQHVLRLKKQQQGDEYDKEED